MTSSSPNLITFLRPQPCEGSCGMVSTNPTQASCCLFLAPFQVLASSWFREARLHFLGVSSHSAQPFQGTALQPATGWDTVAPAAPKIGTYASVHLRVSLITTLGKMTEISKKNRINKYPRIVQSTSWAYSPKFLASKARHQTCTFWLTFFWVK